MAASRAARAAVVASAALAAMSGAAAIAPALGWAAQCGPGTFYDAPTDTCLVAAAAPVAPPPLPPPLPAPPPPLPPPPPPPPAWNGPVPVVSASICAPIPIVNLCVGI